MPSSIQLSVVFTDRSEANLREVWLEEPWQDLLQGMMFSSSKPSLDMEDVSSQVERYIENIFSERFASQWPGVKIQVQVCRIMDQANALEIARTEPVTQRLKPGDTVVMDLNAFPRLNQGTQETQQPECSDEMLEAFRSGLRFGLNDRVLCWCGPRHFSGHVVGTAVPDLASGTPFAYLVKTDALPEVASRTISVPSDNDGCCVQEVCFDPATQLDLVRCAASVITETHKHKLRFALGDKVVCRIQNHPDDGLENWVPGFISEIWPEIGEAAWDVGEASGKFPNVVPYKIELSACKSGRWVYCHRDDHTLVRREGMQSVVRVKGISKRIEHLTGADGDKFCIDHVTGRRKRELEQPSDNDFAYQ